MSEHSPGYFCRKHGAVVGFTPFFYTEPNGEVYRKGPFCPMCISEWYEANFDTLTTLPDTGSSRA